MNKAMKNLIFVFFILCSFFFYIKQVDANSIHKIDMDVYLDSNGNASITEVWDAYLTQGTEGYKPYKKLGNSSISNFNVSDDSGKTYESLSYWDTSTSFDNKSYKSGIHKISNGVELCWGISSYGKRTYILKYDISNFVTQYTDTQGIYFNFLNLKQLIGNAKITIHSDIPFSLDNARIWAFGNNGTITFEDGKIVLSSNGPLSSSQYMVALVRFENNLFHTTNTSAKSFDNIYDSAMSGVSKKDNSKENILSIFYIFLIIVFNFLLNPFIWLLFLLRKKNLSIGKKVSGTLDFGENGKILPSDNKINYFREIPCNKNLERAYWIAYNYNVVSINTLREGIIGAILLKWIKDGLITVSKTKEGLFSFKDNNYAIDLRNINYTSNEIENELLGILKDASGNNEILEAREFEKWCNKNYRTIENWFLSLNWREQTELENQNLIINTQKQITGLFGQKRMVNVKKVDLKLREEAIQLKGLKKFLLDFSIMPEREYFEVHMWEEYLIYAQLLGIADKVEKQFSKLYPNFNQQTRLNTSLTTVAIRNIAYIGYKGYKAGRSSRTYSGGSCSSGGGGRSYSSGGHSSGGSSGGGFR